MMMTTNHRWAISCFVALCLSISQAKLCAQRPFEEEESREGPEPVQRLRVNFSGGELSQYVELLRKEAPEFNIVLTPDVMKFELGPIHLNNVSPSTAVNLIEKLTDNELAVDFDSNLVTINSNVEANHVHVETIGDLILKEREERTDDGRVTLNDLLSAVEAALEFVRSPKPAKMKVHPETGLFIVSGRFAQVEMVSTVVNSLRAARAQIQNSEVVRLGEELKAKDRERIREMGEMNDRYNRLTRTLAQKEDQLRQLEARLRKYEVTPAE